MRYSSVALAAIGLALAGCLAQQQRAAVQENASCLQTAYNLPETAPIRAHTPFNVNDATLAQLADASLASKPEIDAITAVHPRLQTCQKQLLAHLTKLAPTFSPLLAKSYRDADDDVLALMQRKMTWGEFTRRRRDRAIAFDEAAAVIEQRLAAENQANQAAAMQELATAAAIIQASRPVQPQATFTSCTQQGVFTNCWQR